MQMMGLAHARPEWARPEWARPALAGLCVLACSGCGEAGGATHEIAGADPARGLALIETVGCAACHAIPGVDWPQGQVGGNLEGFGARALIDGRHPNQPDVLVRWILDPPSLSPATAMPPTPVSEADARDIAAYLYSLEARR